MLTVWPVNEGPVSGSQPNSWCVIGDNVLCKLHIQCIVVYFVLQCILMFNRFNFNITTDIDFVAGRGCKKVGVF